VERATAIAHLGLCVGLLCICCATGISGQAASSTTAVSRLPVTAGRDLRFAHLALADGPSRSSDTQIVQDDLGFLWFGTEDGLRRYDGYRLREYRHDPQNANSPSGNHIIALRSGQSGQLWLVSDVSVDRFDPRTETFTHYQSGTNEASPAGASIAVGDLSQDRQGLVWLSGVRGLDRLDPSTGRTRHYEHRPGDSTSLSSTSIESTFEQRDGTFRVATQAGLDVFDRATARVIDHIPVPTRPASACSRITPARSG
jgi:hypothetical protein